MSDEKLTMLAAQYPSKEVADTILDTLERMHKGVSITLKDGAVITKGDDGKIKVEETDELTTGEGATRGAIVGGVVGLIFPPSILATTALGGAIGGILGKIRDTGIKNNQMKELGENLTAGQAIVVALVTEDSILATQEALEGYDGELIIEAVGDDVAKAAFEIESSNKTLTDPNPDFK